MIAVEEYGVPDFNRDKANKKKKERMNQIKSADSLLTPRQHYTNKPHHNALLHFATIDRPTNNNNTSSNPQADLCQD
jgi:hypothetical protein